MSPARVSGVHDPRSVGVARYVGRLAAALGEAGVHYEARSRPASDGALHLHLANSSRRVALQAPRRRPYAMTVHDVVPRTAALAPLYRALVYPHAVGRARRVVVHSRFAAGLLMRTAGVRAAGIEVIPHPATANGFADRAAARAYLGIAPGPPLLVLPGILKGAKLAAEAVAAAAPLLASGQARLLLAGRIADPAAVAQARAAGATLLSHPSNRAYDAAVAAADGVLVLRSTTVGESNGPLLDAIGARQPVIATAVGSIPEVAGDAALLVPPTVSGIRAAIETWLDTGCREQLAAAAARRAADLSWAASASAHRGVLEEVM